MTRAVEHLAYLVAAVLFIFSLHWMNTPKTARRGVLAGVAGMTLAILATWIQPQIVHHGWIVLAMIAGFLVGHPAGDGISHRRAAANGPVACIRRPRRRAGRDREVLFVDGRGIRSTDPLPHVRNRRGGHSRVPDSHRQLDGGGQIAGSLRGSRNAP